MFSTHSDEGPHAHWVLDARGADWPPTEAWLCRGVSFHLSHRFKYPMLITPVTTGENKHVGAI